MSASPDDHPLLLCVPGAGGLVTQWVLHLPEWWYEVQQQGDLWQVSIRGRAEIIYAGPGPVELLSSPAPF